MPTSIRFLLSPLARWQMAHMLAKTFLMMYGRKYTAKARGQFQEESTVVTAM
jgi:hypothetical protein